MDPVHLRGRLDADVLEQWVNDVWERGRAQGCADPRKRLPEMEGEGIVAEILFPDFGMPFEAFGPPSQQFVQGTTGSVGADPSQRFQGSSWPPRTKEEIDEGNRAHNRWLVDYCSTAPDRFCAMAVVSFDDVEAAMAEISWAREAGLRGVVLPTFTADAPLFHPRYDPLWSLLEDLEMPANSHVAISATVERVRYSGIPHPAVATSLHSAEMSFRCHEILAHLIWGGVLERHPRLGVTFTEQGSAWVPSALENWDYSYEGSYLRRDVRKAVKQLPSEYFRRQYWSGSSLFSRTEIEARHRIGIDSMLLGMDYRHHEGTIAAGGTTEYLRATLGAAGVPADEARRLLGETPSIGGSSTGLASALWQIRSARTSNWY